MRSTESSADRSHHTRGVALMITAALLWSVAGVFSRFLESATRWEPVFWRSLFCAFGMVAIALILYRSRAPAVVRGLGRIGLVSGALWAMQFTCFMLALTLTTVANALVIVSLAPLFAALMARIVLGEPLGLRTLAMITLAFTGVVVMFGGNASAGQWIGNLIALLVPIGSGLNWVVLRRARAQVDLVPGVLIGAVLSALLTLPLALPFQATATDLAILGGLGLFQLALPCALSVVAARCLSATEMSLLATLEVIAGPIWVWLGVGEQPSAHALAGGSLVLAALVIETVARSR